MYLEDEQQFVPWLAFGSRAESVLCRCNKEVASNDMTWVPRRKGWFSSVKQSSLDANQIISYQIEGAGV